MMAAQDSDASVVSALAACADVRAAGPASWLVTVPGCASRPISVRHVDGWLLFDAPAPSLSSPETSPAALCWDLLTRNASLCGGAKFVRSGDALRLRAELLCTETTDLAARVRAVCADFAAVLGDRETGTASVSETPRPPREDASEDAATENEANLQRRYEETGWPYTVRAPGVAAVQLDVRGAYAQAIGRQGGDNTVLAVELNEGTRPVSPVCEEALGLLLLQAGAVVRMMRPAAGTDFSARFEVVFTAPPPSAEELTHAIGALCLAWREAGREAAVLAADERVATEYLELNRQLVRKCH